MPCATRPERIAIVLCGGTPAPDAALLAKTLKRVEAAGFQALQLNAHGDTPGPLVVEEAGLGPLGGIVAAADTCSNLDGGCLLAVPSDMPNLNPRALQRLADIAEADGRGAVFDLGPLPMILILTPSLRQVLVSAVNDPESRSLTGLVKRLRLPVVASMPDDGLDNLVRRHRIRRAPETAGS